MTKHSNLSDQYTHWCSGKFVWGTALPKIFGERPSPPSYSTEQMSNISCKPMWR